MANCGVLAQCPAWTWCNETTKSCLQSQTCSPASGPQHVIASYTSRVYSTWKGNLRHTEPGITQYRTTHFLEDEMENLDSRGVAERHGWAGIRCSSSLTSPTLVPPPGCPSRCAGTDDHAAAWWTGSGNWSNSTVFYWFYRNKCRCDQTGNHRLIWNIWEWIKTF